MLVFAAATAGIVLLIASFIIALSRHGRAKLPRAGITIAFASQTGRAERIAQWTARTLTQAGHQVALRELGRLRPRDLRRAGILLVVASTYGVGEPPDTARGFARRYLRRPRRLKGLRFGVLALGNRDYPNFCRFGRTVDAWLRRSGAEAMFDLIPVDGDHDDAALEAWRRQLAALKAQAERAPLQTYRSWRLVERRPLNPGSAAEACHLAFVPVAGDPAPEWVAGDIAVIPPRHPPEVLDAYLESHGLDGARQVRFRGEAVPLRAALARCELPDAMPAPDADIADFLRPLPDREYSIASIAAKGRLELLVRRLILPNGALSLSSGYLTRDMAVGSTLPIGIRSNPTFHPPPQPGPMILIGAGTGIAGLRAHLQHRQARGLKQAWLIFGERSGADAFYRNEIEGWRQDGTLARYDFCPSRGEGRSGYVQQFIRAAARDIRRRVRRDGASVFVCGRFEMGTAVHAALARILGEGRLSRMMLEGRYRRDIY